MYCRNNGKEIDEKADICRHCGVETGVENSSGGNRTKGDASGVGWWFFGFFFPLAGLILFIIWKREYQSRAKRVGIGAIIGALIITIIYVWGFWAIRIIVEVASKMWRA